jgi:hypothetical protein
VRECRRSRSSPEEPSPQSKAFTSSSPLVSRDACMSSEGRTWVGPRGAGWGTTHKREMIKLPFARGKYFGCRKWEEMRGNFKHHNITLV